MLINAYVGINDVTKAALKQFLAFITLITISSTKLLESKVFKSDTIKSHNDAVIFCLYLFQQSVMT